MSRWATLIQDRSARRTKDSQPSGFGLEYCASHVRFRVFQQTASSRGPQGSKQHLALAAPATRTRTQRPRKYLAIHAAELVVEPNFQILRRHRRSLLLRLEHAHRSAVENHVHRPPRLGSRRSVNLRIGIKAIGLGFRPKGQNQCSPRWEQRDNSESDTWQAARFRRMFRRSPLRVGRRRGQRQYGLANLQALRPYHV